MAVDPGPHIEDPDPRGPDYADPPKMHVRTIIQAVGSSGPVDALDQYMSEPCLVCGLVHKSEPDV